MNHAGRKTWEGYWREEDQEADQEEEDLAEGGYLEEHETQRYALPVLKREGGHK